MKRKIHCLFVLSILVVLVGSAAAVVFCGRGMPSGKRIAEATFDLILPQFAYADSTFGPPLPPPPPPIP